MSFSLHLRRRTAAAALGAVALAALGGCGTSDDRDQARAVVERFYAAIRADRGDEACAQLSAATVEQLVSQEGKPCPEAVTGLEYEGGAVASTEVYITNAKVDLSSGESAFLSRDADGWRISALACMASGGKPADRPFECEVEA
ncbi:MAG TPA: hypothetical protein VFR97_01455 [Capillimicrobium sp.]|nr:hypothetical protein [Capillimicrobium sp.]